MIRAAAAPELLVLPVTGEVEVRIRSLLLAYGTDRMFLRFWMSSGGSVIALTDGVATVHMGSDIDEVALFLHMNEDVRTVRTDGETARRLALRWECEAVTGACMVLDHPETPSNTVTVPPVRALYPVLTAVFGAAIPPFDAWYADAHHRFRHNLLRAVAISDGERVLSCAMTTAESEHEALIGGVATLPTHRGRGYASSCVSALAIQLQKEGRTVWISPKNAHAARLYQKIGFVTCGEWGTVQVENGKEF